ncbi:DUF2510 domain-containing protein [Arthrobacter sp. PAMC25564]|uniref:DUF2510 domain-containing protein n=1 Tax=Arthrobacter sp. PAMC25564 TaxID=2565366 RepID=UPI0010A29DE7|nr:DUF2510 domain-containing protein [Arthrobacter sp. PAMC25564]QCB97385.1 DUF2510 domain-containing protein [Arthrobacter sp. PAMC25564]
MTVPPGNQAPGNQVPGPRPAPGWYPDPAGSGRLRWWDGTAWTGHLNAPTPAIPAGRPQISGNTPVYNLFIWLIVALPIIPLIILMFWNPVLRLRTTGLRRVQTADPAAIFTLPYFLLIASAFLIYAVSAVMAYLDWQKLRRDGVVRPFHWAWVFLSRELYVIGRSVIVHEVAPRRGLAPVWATIGMVLLALVLVSIKASTLITAMSGQLTM